MPTSLGQSNSSIYGDIQLPKLLSITGPQQSMSRASAGPTKGQLEFGADQQKQQTISSLASQYLSDPDNPDYDTFIQAVGTRYPDDAIDMGTKVEKWRQESAKKDVEHSKANLAKLSEGALALQQVAEQPGLYTPDFRASAVKAFGPIADKVLPATDDPDAPTKVLGVLKALQSQQDYLKGRAETSQLFADGKKVEGALGRLAISANPQMWDAATKEVKAMGMGSLLQGISSPEDAKTALAAYQAQQPQKAGESAKVGSFEDYVTRTYGANPTPANILAARKAYGQADDRALKVSVGGGGAPSSGDLTPEGIDYAATIYRLTNKMPPLGMGKTPARGQIINKAAEQTRLLGQTPVAAIQRQAMFSADNKSLGKIQTMSDAASAYEQKALSQLDIVDNLSDKVSRSSIPLLNRALLAGKTEIQGDPNATLLLNAIQTATAEYSKIMAGGTGSAQASSDSAMREAQKLLSASFSAPTLRKATGLMRQEMGLTMQGYDAAIKHIQDRIGGQSQQGAPDTAAPAGQTQKIGRFTVTVK